METECHKDRVKRKRFGNLVECLRITNRCDQKDLAHILGTSQSAVSKIENGQLTLTAFQWSLLCEKFNVPMESVRYAFIDKNTVTKIETSEYENGYYVPQKYASYKCIKVRALLPIIQYLDEKMGDCYFENLLQSFEMAREKRGSNIFRRSFFCNLDNQINLAFWDDLIKTIGRDISIDNNFIKATTRTNLNIFAHGNLYLKYQEERSKIQLIKSYIAHSKSYHAIVNSTLLEKDSSGLAYAFEINKSVLHLFNETSDLFRCYFLESYEQHLESIPSLHLNCTLEGEVRVSKVGSMISGENVLTYRFYAA